MLPKFNRFELSARMWKRFYDPDPSIRIEGIVFPIGPTALRLVVYRVMQIQSLPGQKGET